MKRIVGIGNALTDMLVNLSDDGVLESNGLARGSMVLVDAATQKAITKSVAGMPYSLSLGGSAGNTIRALASMGCQGMGYIGEVGQDSTGDFFEQALINLGIQPHIFPRYGAFGQVYVAHLSRWRAYDAHSFRCGTATCARDDLSIAS